MRCHEDDLTHSRCLRTVCPAVPEHFSFLAAVVMLARRRVGTPANVQVVLRSSAQRILWARRHTASLAALAALLEENSVAWDFWIVQRHSCFAWHQQRWRSSESSLP